MHDQVAKDRAAKEDRLRKGKHLRPVRGVVAIIADLKEPEYEAKPGERGRYGYLQESR